MLCDRIGITDNFLNVNSGLAELNVFKIVHVFEEIEFICIFHIVDVGF